MEKASVKSKERLEKDIDGKLMDYINGQDVDKDISGLLSNITRLLIGDMTVINKEGKYCSDSDFETASNDLITDLSTRFKKMFGVTVTTNKNADKAANITICFESLDVDGGQFVDSIKQNFSIDNMLSQIKFKAIEIDELVIENRYEKKIFDDTIQSIALFLCIRECYNSRKYGKVEPCLISSLLNMQVYLDVQFIFAKTEWDEKNAIKSFKFIQDIDDNDIRQEYLKYICRYLNKYTKLWSQQKLKKLFDIPLTSGEKIVKLGDRIKIVDEKDQLITNLQDFKTEHPEKKISFKVIDSKPIVKVENKNIEKEKNEIINKIIVENNKEIENNNNDDKKFNSANDKGHEIEIKNVDKVDIDKLIETINKEAKLLEDLDKYVSECLATINSGFQNADEFINFKRNKITEYLNTIDKFKKYEFQAEDLEKLDDILLSGKTAVNIVKKFNLKKKLYSNEGETVKKAVNTFQKLLNNVKKTEEEKEDGKFLPDDFYNFLYNNFSCSDSWYSIKDQGIRGRVQFTTEDIDNMIDCVDTSKPFSTNGRINTILQYLELKKNVQPSDKLRIFLLNSANLYSIDNFAEIINYLSVGFNNIDKTLECIFDIKFADSPFRLKLLQIEDIEQKLSPMNLLKSYSDKTKYFAFYLLENGIEIKKIEDKNGKKVFKINKTAKKLQDFSEAELISCLEQEHGLNAFVQKHIADMINDKSKELKDADLINARSDAINAFLNSSEQLKQRYKKLLSQTDLLNTVKLLAETSVYCIDELFAKLSNNAKLKKTLLQNWQFTEAKYEVGGISFNDFLFERRSMHITKEYLDFCFTHNLINNTLNVKTHKSLYVLLLALEDGNCTDKVLECFSSALSEKKINFETLICANPETEDFEQCLANAIYQLIRTSPDYTDFGIGINNDKQIKAISNVLTNDGDKSDNYQWFRDGLFEWLKNQEKNINDILKQNKDLDTMLSVCGITVGYDKKDNQIKCNNSDEIENASITADQILNLFKKSNRDTSVSLSKIKKIMERKIQEVPGAGPVVLPMDQNQQNSFMSLISEGKIVISTSKISELFDLKLKDQVDDFFETNDIARKLMWKIIDDELFDPETGLFKKTDIFENEICQKYQDGLVDCLKKVKIVVGEDQKEISVDLSRFEDEFLSSVGIINFDTLSEKYEALFDLIKYGQFSISDRNFNAFWDFFKAKFNKEQDGQQIIALFEQLTDKIEDFSLSCDNVQQLISTFLNQTTEIKFNQDNQDNIDKFCSITQKLISKKLKLVNDGDDRFLYMGTAIKIFEEICKFFTNDKNKDKDASNIILILDSLIRKQDECYQCGKLIDALNEICYGRALNIGDEKLQKARELINNKIMITDYHGSDTGYKFVIDFELKKEKEAKDKQYLYIPINAKYIADDRNQTATKNLESYINNSIKNNTLKFDNCGVDKKDFKNLFDSVIQQIKAWFNETGINRDVSQEVILINKITQPDGLDRSDDNLIYVLKSKPLKLSKNTLKNILTKIFEGNKIKDAGGFFDQFAPWFVHVLSNYLDLSTLDGSALSDLLDVCIDKNLQFTNKDACKLAKNFLAECLKATMKNGSESCVNLNFIDSIIKLIDPKCYFGDPESDISCIFDFIKEHVDQIKIDNNGFSIYSLVLAIVEQMFLKKDDKNFIDGKPNVDNQKDEASVKDEKSLLLKTDKNKHDILDRFNNSGLYILQKDFNQLHLVRSITDKSSHKFTIVITPAPGSNGFIKQIQISKGLDVWTDQNCTKAKDKANQNIVMHSTEKTISQEASNAGKVIENKLNDQAKLQTKHKNEEKTRKQKEKQDIDEALKKWNEDNERKKQNLERKEQNLIGDVSFLTKLVNEKFDELVKSKFGVLDNNAVKGDKQFDGFLDGLAKIVNCLEGCKSEDIKKNLSAKMKNLQSQITKESLTFEQMTRFLDLVIKISNWKPSIKRFLSDWCNKYIKADSKKSCSDNLYKYIKDKPQYSLESIENRLKILKFVIDNKGVINVDDLKKEIQVFFKSGILSFKKDECKKEEISNAVVDFVSWLKIDIDDEDVGNPRRELQDMFFDYINSQIFENDPKYHLETNKEKEEKRKQANEEELKEINKEIVKNEDDAKTKLKENYNKLKKNIEDFLKLENVTSDNVKNIFKDIDIDNNAMNVPAKQRVLTEEKQITNFIDLLSQVNKKMSTIKDDNSKNKNNGSVPLVEYFFHTNVLTLEQCSTLVEFIVLSCFHVEGHLYSVDDIRNLVEDFLKYNNNKKTLATNMFQIIGKLKAHIDFQSMEEFFILMDYGHIEFNSIENNDDCQAIIQSINENNILQLFISADLDFKYKLQYELKNKDITLETIKSNVESSVQKVFKELKGLDIDEDNQLCYNKNVKEVDENRKIQFVHNLTKSVIEQLLKYGLIKENQKDDLIKQLNQKENPVKQPIIDNNLNENLGGQIASNKKYDFMRQRNNGGGLPDNPKSNKKKNLVLPIVLLIVAVAGIAATLAIGLEATAILAAFIASCVLAVIGIGLLIYRLRLKNPPNGKNLVIYNDDKLKTMEEQIEGIKENQIKYNQNKGNKDKSNEEDKNRKYGNEINEI